MGSNILRGGKKIKEYSISPTNSLKKKVKYCLIGANLLASTPAIVVNSVFSLAKHGELDESLFPLVEGDDVRPIVTGVLVVNVKQVR